MSEGSSFTNIPMMHVPEAPLPPLDELTQVQLSVAKRANELRRTSDGDPVGRDFWAEAESEVWATRVEAWAVLG